MKVEIIDAVSMALDITLIVMIAKTLNNKPMKSAENDKKVNAVLDTKKPRNHRRRFHQPNGDKEWMQIRIQIAKALVKYYDQWEKRELHPRGGMGKLLREMTPCRSRPMELITRYKVMTRDEYKKMVQTRKVPSYVRELANSEYIVEFMPE
jgi:hypothetical protein